MVALTKAREKGDFGGGDQQGETGSGAEPFDS